MRITFLYFALLTPAVFGQTKAACDLVTQAEADSLLGGSTRQIPVGKLGCGYSYRASGLNLSITVMDLAGMAKQTWDGLKNQASTAHWLAGDEAGMGTSAYAQLIKRSAESSAGKCGFVVLKGNNVLQIFVTDRSENADLAGKKEMLDKLRPVAKKAVDRL